MSLQRSALIRSTGIVKYNGLYFMPREKLNTEFMPTWEAVMNGMYGEVDRFKKDLPMKFMLRLWGAWENLSTLFPSYIMNPIPGTSIFGTTDTPLLIWGRNSDQLTYTNAQITRLANLYLGVDSDLFAADVEFTALIGNNKNPEDAGAFATRSFSADSLGVAYSEATVAFAKTNFKRLRFTAAWGAISGFTSMTPQKGINVSWDFQPEPVPADGFGTVDMSVGKNGMVGMMKMIPVGASPASLKTNSQEETQYGTLASAISADLTATANGGAPVVTLKNAFLKEHRFAWDTQDLRIGEATWATTRGFTGGVPAVVASVA